MNSFPPLGASSYCARPTAGDDDTDSDADFRLSSDEPMLIGYKTMPIPDTILRDQIAPLNDSLLPRVCSDVARYLADGDPAISRLSADCTARRSTISRRCSGLP